MLGMRWDPAGKRWACDFVFFGVLDLSWKVLGMRRDPAGQCWTEPETNKTCLICAGLCMDKLRLCLLSILGGWSLLGSDSTDKVECWNLLGFHSLLKVCAGLGWESLGFCWCITTFMF